MPYSYIEIASFGGPEVLQLKQEKSLPEPGRGEVRVKVLAAGTGFTDTIIRDGDYPGVKEKPPFTPGYDWFGVVDKLGVGVQGLEPGQAVADMPVIGGYTQYLCADAARVIPCPQGLDPAQAVCMILPYTTAYQMLTRECQLQRGDRILVHAAAGAVGSALVELGRLLGLEVYGTASSGKHDLLRAFGAIPIDYRSEDFVARTLELSGGGVDAVFDTVGGKNWAHSYRCLRRGGKLVGFGSMQLSTGEESLPQLLWGFAKLLGLWKFIPDGKSSSFYNIQSSREKNNEAFNKDVHTLMQWLRDGKLHPVVDERVPLGQVADVHRRIASADIKGRVALICQGQDTPRGAVGE
ncbi:MAG: zinc-binding dehydrogenase [Halieaceae bacterium]|jgi:NADPH:quinone reductase-like Zn-dependent oxidoreductase|nr:zinc-binding dehydrogenase [Halieaceae bacterium]